MVGITNRSVTRDIGVTWRDRASRCRRDNKRDITGPVKARMSRLSRTGSFRVSVT